MYNKIKKIASSYLRRNNVFQDTYLSGVKLKTLPNSVRKKVDKDDAWFFTLAQNSQKIFDIGCNIGYTSLIAAIHKNTTNILLVDPNPEALSKASQNMIINGFGSRAKFVSAFVGDKDGEKVRFYTVGSGAAGSMFSSHAETAAAMKSFYEVEKITIDTLVEIAGFSPDLIKIDVEGAESLALLGALNIAQKQTAKFFIEMHSPKELPMVKNAQLIIDWCQENQYRPFYLKDMVELVNAEMIAHRGKCHLLLMPSNASIPEYIKNISEGAALPTFI